MTDNLPKVPRLATAPATSIRGSPTSYFAPSEFTIRLLTMALPLPRRKFRGVIQ